MSYQHCFKDQGKKVKKKKYISFFHIFICLSFVLIGCQTNNFDVFNLGENINYNDSINNKRHFSDLKLSVPKYKSFSSNNAQANVKKAIRAHPSFHRNVASLEQRKSDIKQVEASKESQINFQALGGFSRADEENQLGLTGSVNFVKVLYDYGAIDQAIKAEKQKIKSAEFEVVTEAERIGYLAYVNWINLLFERRIMDVYKKGIKNAEPLVEKIDQISLSGIADSTLILRARKEYSETIVKMKQSEVLEQKADANFINIFGLNETKNVGSIKPKSIKNYKYHENQMIKNSPNLKALRAFKKSLFISKESLVSQKNPNISLRAGINAPADDPIKNGSANVGFLLNYVYDDGGKLDAQIENVENQINYSELNYNNALKELKLELSVAFKAYKGALETKKNLIKLITLSENVRNNLNDQLSIGRAKLEDLLSAEVNLANNEILLLNAERDLLLNSYKIYYLSVGFFPGSKWY